MISREDLLVWYRCLGLSEEARTVIDRVRSADPSRRVESGHGNVSGRLPGRKMGTARNTLRHNFAASPFYKHIFAASPDLKHIFAKSPTQTRPRASFASSRPGFGCVPLVSSCPRDQ